MFKLLRQLWILHMMCIGTDLCSRTKMEPLLCLLMSVIIVSDRSIAEFSPKYKTYTKLGVSVLNKFVKPSQCLKTDIDGLLGTFDINLHPKMIWLSTWFCIQYDIMIFRMRQCKAWLFLFKREERRSEVYQMFWSIWVAFGPVCSVLFCLHPSVAKTLTLDIFFIAAMPMNLYSLNHFQWSWPWLRVTRAAENHIWFIINISLISLALKQWVLNSLRHVSLMKVIIY